MSVQDGAIRWELAESGVLTLTIDRPEVKNAIDTPAQRLLVRHLLDAGRHPLVKVVVLTGSGSAFCTGADVRSVGAPDPEDAIASQCSRLPSWQAYESRVDRLRELARASQLLHAMGKPTIAKLRGAAAGCGMSLALACDFRLAASDAFMVSSFAKMGASGDYGISYFLTQLVGPSKAKEVLMFSDRIDANQAHAAGLLNRIVPDVELDAVTERFAVQLAQGPSLAYRYVKDNVHAALVETLEQSVARESAHMIRCRMSSDGAEAAAAFQERRKPIFRGQ